MKKNMKKKMCGYILCLIVSVFALGCGSEQTADGEKQQFSQTAEETADATADQTAEQTADTSADQTADAVVNQTADAAADQTADRASDAVAEYLADPSGAQTEPAGSDLSQDSQAVNVGVVFPVLLDEERVELLSVFEYSGINLDQEDAMVEKTAAIQLKNRSGEYLKQIQVHVTLSDGSKLEFLVKDVPAEMEIVALELESQVYAGQQVTAVTAETEFAAYDTGGKFICNVSESDITVENISGEDQKEVVVYYHCSLDGVGFGGRSYEIPVGDLAAGESRTVTDTECYLGEIIVAGVQAL